MAAQIRRARESETELAGEPGLWADQLRKLRRSLTRSGPVLTAHPTEAKLPRRPTSGTLQDSDPAGFYQVVDLRKTFPFLRFVLTNAETNLSSAEPTIMDKYATLYPSEERVNAVFHRIMEEFDLTQSMLEEVLGGFGVAASPVHDDPSNPGGRIADVAHPTGHSVTGLAVRFGHG